MYGCETWVIDKAAEKPINAFECKYDRKILRIAWTDEKKTFLFCNNLIFKRAGY